MNQLQSFKDYEIDGQVYTINLFVADKGLEVATKLFKIIGEPMLQLSLVQNDKANMPKYLLEALKTLLPKLSETEVVALCKTLCSVVTLQNSSQTLDQKFNMHFRGRYGHLFKVLAKVVEYNFADFLGELGLGENLPQQANK